MRPHVVSATLPPGLNSYQRTDYLNGVFNRSVGDKLVGWAFIFAALSLRDSVRVLLPNIRQLILIRRFIGENKRLANKDYLLFSTIEHPPGAATPAQIQLTI